MSRAQISSAEFACPDGHQFRAHIRREPFAVYYRPIAAGAWEWAQIAKCPEPGCPLIGSEGSAGRDFACVPESERFEGWLAPDGSKIAVPGRKGAQMPERYRRAGYVRIEARSIGDLDRIERIRAAQTGGEAYSEMQFSAAQRAERQAANYNDDPNSDV